MKVFIFTEGGGWSGFGHISRCSALYDELVCRDIEVKFIINSELTEIDFIQNKRYEIIDWRCPQVIDALVSEADYCIIDSYEADERIYRHIAKRAKRVFYIDDTSRIKYPAGVIINPSISHRLIDYSLSTNSKLLCGPEYVILREVFQTSSRVLVNPDVREVLITMGGSDPENLTLFVLNLFMNTFPDIIFNVVVGKAFSNKDEVKRIVQENVMIFEDVSADEMKRLMLRSDFAVTAAGQTIYELIATQTPFIPIQIIENQKNNVFGLIEHHLVENVLNSKNSQFSKTVEKEFRRMNSYEVRQWIVDRYRNVIDGQGCKRIIDKLLDDEEV